MKNKVNTILWSLSLIVISIVTLIWAVCNIFGPELSDTAVRILGALDICAIPVLIFTSIRKRTDKSDSVK